MNLGAPVFSVQRYNLRTLSLLAWWNEESDLDQFLAQPPYQILNQGWHVRLKLYRRWGQVHEIKDAYAEAAAAKRGDPMVAITLARLNLRETMRFVKWGKPVERQVRDHRAATLPLAGMRPLGTFSTFSIWKNEDEMLGMVHGRNQDSAHGDAMKERVRRDFHHEFTTMRFTPIREVGAWRGKSNYLDIARS